MNKTEKLICLVLAAVLAWYIWDSMKKQGEAAKAAREAAVAAMTNAPAATVDAASSVGAAFLPPQNEDGSSSVGGQDAAPTGGVIQAGSVVRSQKPLATPSEPEQTVVLENGDVKLELSSWGAVVKRATLKRYAKDRGEVSDENPAVALDFAESPLGALEGVAGLAPNAAYRVASQTSNEVVFANALAERKVTLKSDYQIVFSEKFAEEARTTSPQQQAGASSTSNHQLSTFNSQLSSLSLGAMRMGDSKNDLLSLDSMARDAGKGKSGVLHHCEGASPLKNLLVGGLSGGCSGSSSAAGMPPAQDVAFPGLQNWIALKNRFFVTALASCDQENVGFDTRVVRDLRSSNYRPESVSAKARFAAVPAARTTVFYVGPKKQSLLWDLGMRDVMEFGMWRWICYPLVWVLNFFHDWAPNYGIAIILLTILVRILFWPLTHKSTVGMKKMQEIQPLMKEIQAKYKDNPQRLQQETWQLYKDKKVNPMSSCLPMLIQIPVFIALFNVLRSAVELRYAPFLWIGDLSEPEALFASWFPFGGLNILPILMAVTTALQSAFTPSTGDAKQQRMMMIMMPAMMLVMFYSFPSALSLYWFLSNLFSIVQMWLIRRQTAAKTEVIVPEVVDTPPTRQQRRHG